MKKSRMLRDGDSIVAAFAQHASGPGWSNTPVWVIVTARGGGDMRLECLQPEEQSPEINALYRISAEVHAAMTAAVKRACKEPKP